VKRFIRQVVFALLFVFAGRSAFAASSDVGVVLMHGKWGAPQSMTALARDLGSCGYLVSNPEMPWSGMRLYDVEYPAALKEIEQQVNDLRAKGAKRIVVAGQSMGANAAVAYASSGFALDALVILSPGHFPELGMGKRLQRSVERARSMVARRTEAMSWILSTTSIRVSRGRSKWQRPRTFLISTPTVSAQ
jgi:esterase/lipase